MLNRGPFWNSTVSLIKGQIQCRHWFIFKVRKIKLTISKVIR